MASASTTPSSGFGDLRRALLRRRIQRIEPRLRIEIAAIAAMIGAFIFWQLRIRFAGISYARGAGGVDRDCGLILVSLALLGGITAGVRFARIVRRGGTGPAWLTLPVAGGALRDQFAWESRFASAWVLVPAAAAFVAAVGLAHPIALVAILPGFAFLLLLAAHAGCLAADRLLTAGPGRIESRLSYGATRGRVHRSGATTWRRVSLPLALWFKDALLLARSSKLRGRLAPAVLFALLSAAVWFIPNLGRGAHPLAFALALIAAGAYGEWILALSGADPFSVLRSLPVGWGKLWISRMIWVALGTVVLLLLNAVAAHSLSASSRLFFLGWLLLASLALLALAVHYAQTVFPRAAQAQRLYELALGLAIVGSLLIPLLGWIVLLTAVIHSGLRLHRWATIEDRP